jgi:Ca2+-binding RTX toxin-like protein
MAITGTPGPDIIEIDQAFAEEPTNVTVDTLGGNDRIVFRWQREAPESDPQLQHVTYDIDGGTGTDTLSFSVGDDPEFNIDTVLDARSGTIETVSFTSVERFVLIGANGNDTLYGGDGADHLDGKGHSDEMHGGKGSDIYEVNVDSDQVIELNGEGSDTIRSLVSLTLPSYVENLILTGGQAITGNGNGLNNVLVGNALANTLRGRDGHDRLDGGAGPDRLEGGLGHDVYVVDDSGDAVIELGSSGNDTVESAIDYRLPTHVEKLVLTGTAAHDGRGNTGDNSLTGNSAANLLDGGRGDDRISGGNGGDRIYGGLGNDVLAGGSGVGDRFMFNTELGPDNVDRILDFYAPNDSIYLNRDIFTEAGPNGELSPAAFRQGSAAAAPNDRIVYDEDTGRIFYDSDGSGAGAAVLFATVTPGTTITNDDFIVYG